MEQKELSLIDKEQLEEMLQQLKEKSKKPKKEFTKKMYEINVIFAFFVTLISLTLILLSAFFPSLETSSLPAINATVWAEVGVYSAFMIWKAKCENIHKYPNIIEEVKEADNIVNGI